MKHKLHTISMALALAGAFLSQSSQAQTAPQAAKDISPGLWEIVMNTNVPDQPDWKPEPFRVRQCLTAFDAANPEKLISGMATQGATGCTFTQSTNAGGVIRFANTCSGTHAIKTTGAIRFTATSMEGNMRATANVGGQQTVFENQITGRHLGACK
jgi:hypothetical protein